MKGVLICGGSGSRLYPLTKTVNKQLLPVYDQPLVHYPLRTLMQMGLRDIMIVSGMAHAEQFVSHFSDYEEFKDVRFQYAIQKTPGGIAQALGLARDFAGDDTIAVMLGDNIYEDNFSAALADFNQNPKGAKVFLKEVPDPERFGCPEFDDTGAICKIIEKPKEPPSRFCVTGLYFYDSSVWDVIENLKPSARGELEITDVNNHYVFNGTMTYHPVHGQWIDAGTFQSLLKANIWAAEQQGVSIDDLTRL